MQMLAQAGRRSQTWLKPRTIKKTSVIKSKRCRNLKTATKNDSGRTHRNGGLKAITLKCPELAVAILAKQKNIENRTWQLPSTAVDSSGHAWLALHVAGAYGGRAYMPQNIRKHMLEAWNPKRAYWPWNKMDLSKSRTGAPLPNSAIVGLIRIRKSRKLERGERKMNPWALGPICWEIDRAVKLDPPIENVNGNLLLWSIDHEPSISSYGRRRLKSALFAAKNSQFGTFKPNNMDN